MIILSEALVVIAMGMHLWPFNFDPVHDEAVSSVRLTGNWAMGETYQGENLPPLDCSYIIEFSVTGVELNDWTSEPGKGSRTRIVNIALRLDGVIKGRLELVVGKEANVSVIQVREPGGIITEASGFWSLRMLQKDSRYVLFSKGKGGDLKNVFEGAVDLADLSGDTATVSDLRFIVKICALGPADQSAEFCEYMAKSDLVHGRHFAQYLAALAAKPDMPPSAKLYELISRPQELKLSNKGLLTLVDILQMKVAEDEEGNEKLAGPVTLAVCRYIASINPSEAISPNNGDALQNWLPWLAKSEAARKHLNEFRKNDKECLGVVASLEKIRASGDLSEETRRQLKAVTWILATGK